MKKIFIFIMLTVSFAGFSQAITVATNYTTDQLVNQVLINSPCVSGTGVTASTGTDFGSTNGIGYFENSNPNFPFTKGVVLTTGDVTKVPSPNNTILSDGTTAWPGDTQLETVLATQGVNIASVNATSLEFDFTAKTTSFDFNFVFASEEYGTSQCNYSDAFAFLLTDSSNNTQNIAVINGNTPISVETIRDSLYNVNCPSANPEYFGAYNGPGFGPAINFNGQTVELTAHANVVVGQTYHIKLVIADGGNNPEYDSAIFLEANSFNIGQDILPADMALCSYDPLPTIATQATPAGTTFSWVDENGPLTPPQSGAALNLNDLVPVPGPGEHTYTLTYVSPGCAAVDNSIGVTIYPALNVMATVPPIYICDSGAASYNVDLTKNTVIIKNNNTPAVTSDDLPATTTVKYYLTAADANTDTGAIASPYTLLSSENGKIIYARIESPGTPCFVVRSFALNIVNSPVIGAVPPDITLCARDITLPAKAVFDLTATTAAVLSGQDPAYNVVTYYANSTGATAGTPAYNVTPTFLSSTRTLWIRVQNISNPDCFVITSMQLNVTPVPLVDILPDVVVCDSYTLPHLTEAGAGYYLSTNGADPIAEGQLITTNSSKVVYVYNSNGICSGQDSFKVTKANLAAITPASATYCTSYGLPPLPYGKYYENPGGPGANPGGEFTGPITATKTLYVYFEDTTVSPPCVQESPPFTISIIPFTVLPDYPNQFACTSYNLPPDPNGGTYYSGPNKGLPIINPGPISTPGTKTIYVYKETGTIDPNCYSQKSFTVYIGPGQITAPADVESCSTYTLPPLAVGNYYSGPNATLPILTSVAATRDVWISVPGEACTADIHFHVTIALEPLPDFPDVGPVCDVYYLPSVAHTGNYFTAPNGGGQKLDAGDPVIGEGVHTIYFYDELPSDNSCFVEKHFDVTIFDSPPIDARPVEVIRCNQSYVLDDLVNGEYYALPGGPTTAGNTILPPGYTIGPAAGTTTIYVYSAAVTPNTCFQEYSIDVVIVNTIINDIADVSACNTYTLPPIVGPGHYYTLPGGPNVFGGNTEVFPGDVITDTTTLYVYAEDSNRVACSDQDDFTVTIYKTPTVDPITAVTECDSYTLPPYNTFATTPANAVNHYFQSSGGPGGGNVEMFPGDIITSTTTVYAVAQTGTPGTVCFAEQPLAITINHTPVFVPAEIQNVATCSNSYTLPALTVGNYYDDNTHTNLLSDLNITGAGVHTIYVYAETGTTPNCNSDTTFTVTITDTPVLNPVNPITACDSYTIPGYNDPMFSTSTGAPITHFYTFQGGPAISGGNPEKFPGDVISSVGTTTLYPYSDTGTTPNCFDDAPWTITISTTPALVAAELADQYACDSYPLPPLTVGNYYSDASHTTPSPPIISGAGTHTVYVYAESATNPNCSVSDDFVVTITDTPVFVAGDIATVDKCNDYTLPVLATPNANYYTAPYPNGTIIPAGTNYTTSQVIYLHAENGTAPHTCSKDETLTINIYNVDEIQDETVCGEYILPNLTAAGAAYYTGPNGSGTMLTPGSSYTGTGPGTYTLYVYGTSGSGSCSDQWPFVITIIDKPTATMPAVSQTTVCDSDGVNDNVTGFDLDSLTPTILGTQSPATYAVTYYPTLNQAANQTGAIPTDNSTGTDTDLATVFAAVTNIANPGCFTPIQINITVVPKPELAPLTGIICVDGATGQTSPRTITSGYSSSLYHFTWTDSDGVVVSTAPNFTPPEVGTYELVINAYVNGITGCDSDPIPVTVIESLIPNANDISFTTSGWFTDNQILTVNYAGDTTNLVYSLDGNTPQQGNVFTNVTSGMHEITLIDINDCGHAMLPIPVRLINNPKYFTPNGDGVNDTWNIPGLEDQTESQLFIYDRYGKLLKQLHTNGDGWDGTFNGNSMPADDYWFTITYVENGIAKEYKSHFSLVR